MMIHDYDGDYDEGPDSVLSIEKMDVQTLADTVIMACELADSIDCSEQIASQLVATLSVPGELIESVKDAIPSAVTDIIDKDSATLEIRYEFEFLEERPLLTLTFQHTDYETHPRCVVLQRGGGPLTENAGFSLSAVGDDTASSTEYTGLVDQDNVTELLERLIAPDSVYVNSEGVTRGESSIIADPQFPPSARAIIDTLVEKGADCVRYDTYTIPTTSDEFCVILTYDNDRLVEVSILRTVESSLGFEGTMPTGIVRKIEANIYLTRLANSITFNSIENNGAPVSLDDDGGDLLRLREDLQSLKETI